MTKAEELQKSKITIYEISDERLIMLAERIRPILNFGGELGRRYVRPKRWECYYRDEVYTLCSSPGDEPIGLVHLVDIPTHHSRAYRGLVITTIAEVLAQIPEEYLDKIVAFEVIDNSNSRRNSTRKESCIATTRLFALDQ